MAIGLSDAGSGGSCRPRGDGAGDGAIRLASVDADQRVVALAAQRLKRWWFRSRPAAATRIGKGNRRVARRAEPDAGSGWRRWRRLGYPARRSTRRWRHFNDTSSRTSQLSVARTIARTAVPGRHAPRHQPDARHRPPTPPVRTRRGGDGSAGRAAGWASLPRQIRVGIAGNRRVRRAGRAAAGPRSVMPGWPKSAARDAAVATQVAPTAASAEGIATASSSLMPRS